VKKERKHDRLSQSGHPGKERKEKKNNRERKWEKKRVKKGKSDKSSGYAGEKKTSSKLRETKGYLIPEKGQRSDQRKGSANLLSIGREVRKANPPVLTGGREGKRKRGGAYGKDEEETRGDLSSEKENRFSREERGLNPRKLGLRKKKLEMLPFLPGREGERDVEGFESI